MLVVAFCQHWQIYSSCLSDVASLAVAYLLEVVVVASFSESVALAKVVSAVVVSFVLLI